MQTKVGVPQKDRTKISEAIFGDEGLVNADDSYDFQRRPKKVITKAAAYPKFLSYFKKSYSHQ